MNTTTYKTTRPVTGDRQPSEGTIPLSITVKTLLADTVTPVALYLRLRDVFPGAVLLESSDNNSAKNSRSFIAVQPTAQITGQNGKIRMQIPSFNLDIEKPAGKDLPEVIGNFTSMFKLPQEVPANAITGLIGYLGYDSIPYFEDVTVRKREPEEIPFLHFSLYRTIIVFDHLHHQLHIVEQLLPGEVSDTTEVEKALYRNTVPKFQFTSGKEMQDIPDEEFLDNVEHAKRNCAAGNIFQVVLSRKFVRPFSGDEFNVYRTLRAINPSPYLFYADFGNFKIFGSSPEAQLIIRKIPNPGPGARNPLEAVIHPIAGTFRRTGDDTKDAQLEQELLNDPKENAEHIMLVDLARNDLSRNATNVKVDSYREVHRYSHVIHLVSTVTGKVEENKNAFRVLCDTFPAGTLSGAPKIKAIEIIDGLESSSRGYYGGCIGIAGFDGTLNVAIMIRSFLSKNNELQYRAGAGVTINSVPEKELQEINNKLEALRKAMDAAEKTSN